MKYLKTLYDLVVVKADKGNNTVVKTHYKLINKIKLKFILWFPVSDKRGTVH